MTSLSLLSELSCDIKYDFSFLSSTCLFLPSISSYVPSSHHKSILLFLIPPQGSLFSPALLHFVLYYSIFLTHPAWLSIFDINQSLFYGCLEYWIVFSFLVIIFEYKYLLRAGESLIEFHQAQRLQFWRQNY